MCIRDRYTNIVGLILLSRDPDAIQDSAIRFEKKGMKISRFFLRIKKYWYEYGIFTPIALFTRSQHFLNLFGISSGSFGKGKGSGSADEESTKLKKAATDYANETGVPMITIRYEHFKEDVNKLREIGVDTDTIVKLKNDFSPA